MQVESNFVQLSTSGLIQVVALMLFANWLFS